MKDYCWPPLLSSLSSAVRQVASSSHELGSGSKKTNKQKTSESELGTQYDLLGLYTTCDII